MTESATIRPATPADARAIAEVHVASWRSTYRGIVPQPYLDALNVADREARWRDSFTSEMAIFVTEENGTVIGFASVGPARAEFPGLTGELYAIYLLPEAQSHGIGARLFSAIADHLHRAGHTGIYLWVLEQNPACRFYERMGGTRIQSVEIEIGGKPLIEVAYAWPGGA
jgi:GNAT superfamily N-acetyltransferase